MIKKATNIETKKKISLNNNKFLKLKLKYINI